MSNSENHENDDYGPFETEPIHIQDAIDSWHDKILVQSSEDLSNNNARNEVRGGSSPELLEIENQIQKLRQEKAFDPNSERTAEIKSLREQYDELIRNRYQGPPA
ncbi:hypothetical protein H0V99_00370 [Candidatus Saccharibacteria bacterium]|nr:hypothetical protein [Candidatus Saccharibacteria bacterium]